MVKTDGYSEPLCFSILFLQGNYINIKKYSYEQGFRRKKLCFCRSFSFSFNVPLERMLKCNMVRAARKLNVRLLYKATSRTNSEMGQNCALSRAQYM